VDSIRLPLGPFLLKIEKEGFETIESLFFGRSAYVSSEKDQSYSFVLDDRGTIPPGMVRIPQSRVSTGLADFISERPAVSAYLIDKREVTNGQFKEFVNGGGYRTPEYWEHGIVKEGRVLVWAEAMAEFRDRTGRPGPSTWQGGTYPEGQDDYPVSGVSWYEAAAYAKYVGKSLPTIYHWLGATNTYYATYLFPFSNFRDQGVAAVGNGPVGPRGTYDMAGNVKEWCWNASGSLRYILGGSWDEPTYMFFSADAQSPCNRSPTYGFRCVRYLDVDEQSLAVLSRPVELPAQDYRWEEPVSDEIFRAYKSHYSYDPTSLDAVIESVDEHSPYWRRERITLIAAYGEERVIALLFVPKNVDPPYQTVIYFPGSSAVRSRSSEKLRLAAFDFVIMSGRAVMYPVYKCTYERYCDLETTWPNATRAYADHVVRWINALRRSIDYLETRDDIDIEKLAFYGYSWGGHLGPIALALEERLKLGVLVAGGLTNEQIRPEADESVFVPRVTVPVLMVNGADDYIFKLDSSQKPMFERLGTPEEHKKHLVYESGHSVLARSGRRNQAIREILNWLDHYLKRVPPQNPTRS
jgi:dienelactone hydrolase